MGNRTVVTNYYNDVKRLTDLLQKFVELNRFLIGASNEVNGITLASQNDIRNALKRANKSGEILESILDALEQSSHGYFDYCKTKSQIIKNHIEENYIQTEIDDTLKFTES